MCTALPVSSSAAQHAEAALRMDSDSALESFALTFLALETDPLLESPRNTSEYPGLASARRRAQQAFIAYLRDSGQS